MTKTERALLDATAHTVMALLQDSQAGYGINSAYLAKCEAAMATAMKEADQEKGAVDAQIKPK